VTPKKEDKSGIIPETHLPNLSKIPSIEITIGAPETKRGKCSEKAPEKQSLRQ
jgi:hypothetical protein